jgi:hypothetical protein
MCVMCYIGVNSEISEIKFDKNNPAFYIEKMDKSEFDIETFSTDYIYYIGSREGCGCGFGTTKIPNEIISEVLSIVKYKKKIPEKYRQYFEFGDSIEQIEDNIKENQEFVEDTQKLYSLIHRICDSNSQVEFFGCWAGSEKKKLDEISQVDLNSTDLIIDFGKIWNSNIKVIYKK